MRVACVYIFPLDGAGQHGERAMRFLETYHQHPPGLDHETIIVCNGGQAGAETEFLFGSLPNLKLLRRNDGVGQDIGGYQDAAQGSNSDLMVFFGGNTYFRRAGWMNRVVNSWMSKGDTLFGYTANRGAGAVQPHIRTTGFWMSTKLFNQYPHKVTRNDQRYPFEHGRDCLTTWIKRLGKIPWLVSWDGEYKWENWDVVPNGWHKGDQSNLLFGDRLTEPPYHHCS